MQAQSNKPKIGIISLVPDTWNGPWRSRHQILPRLGEQFEVLWMEEARGWREIFLSSRIKNNCSGFTARIRKGFSIYKPESWLPLVYTPKILGRFFARTRLERAKNYLLKLGCTKIVLDLWRPDQAYALDLLTHDFSCYHIVDEYSFSEVEHPVDANEEKLISRVDQVFISSQMLMEKKGHINPNTLLIPNGVHYQAFIQLYKEPEDLQKIPHPRIGYVGILKKQMDFSLLIQLAKARLDWSFVLVGPKGALGNAEELLNTLSALPNVFMLGGKAIEALPAYVQGLDVSLLSYRVTDYSKYINPLKLHEYLAVGHPVIGPPIPPLKNFAHVIQIANTLDEWVSAVEIGLSPSESTSEKIAARRQEAKKFDWNVLSDSVASAIQSGLAKKASSP